MQKFVVKTLGCKVNQYEGQQIRQLLEQKGLSAADPHDKADLVVVNTCCVTHTASAKSRQYLNKARNQHPNATFVVAGCLPAGQPTELKTVKGPVHIVSNKNDLTKTLANLKLGNCDTALAPRMKKLNVYYKSIKTLFSPRFNHPKTNHKKKSMKKGQPSPHDPYKLGPLASYPGKSRAFLKIQDGCDGYCTYCIVPKIRSCLYNKPASTVLQEAYNLIYAGHKEIVLTGIFLGAYGQSSVIRSRWDPHKKNMLADLVDKMALVPGLERIRLSSLEPADVTDRLLDVFRKHRNIMPHLHLPLQCGSERILHKMRRQYTVSQFLQVVDKVKLSLDRPAITTDIIVGFPGETDDDFQQTIKVAKSVGFSKIHVFSFSPRAHTAAAKIQPAVKSEVIKERSATLRELDKNLQAKFRRQFIGEKVGIIVEASKPLRGRTERYFMVELDESNTAEPGQLVWQYL